MRAGVNTSLRFRFCGFAAAPIVHRCLSDFLEYSLPSRIKRPYYYAPGTMHTHTRVYEL
jgi:hypothetical protein